MNLTLNALNLSRPFFPKAECFWWCCFTHDAAFRRAGRMRLNRSAASSVRYTGDATSAAGKVPHRVCRNEFAPVDGRATPHRKELQRFLVLLDESESRNRPAFGSQSQPVSSVASLLDNVSRSGLNLAERLAAPPLSGLRHRNAVSVLRPSFILAVMESAENLSGRLFRLLQGDRPDFVNARLIDHLNLCPKVLVFERGRVESIVPARIELRDERNAGPFASAIKSLGALRQV